MSMKPGAPEDTRAMPCPACGRTGVAPLPDSTLTVAWYTCACGHFWSARVRDGRAVHVAAPDAGVLPVSPARR